MPFNGGGVFLRVRKWANDAAANIPIRADYHDSEDDNLASGLSQCITKDGQTTITANLPMATYRHTNVGAATTSTQYARYDQVSSGRANWAIAGGSGDALTASFSPSIGSPIDGQEINIRLSGNNTGTAITIAVDGGTALSIKNPNGDSFEPGNFYAGREVVLRYRQSDTSWVLVNDIPVLDADNVNYDNSTSGLAANNVQEAIDEVVEITSNRMFETGDTVKSYRSSKVGWILASGLTIGNASSGATGRANADTQDLFTLLWNDIPALVIQDSAGVTSTRGANAAADYAANKRLALPDERGTTDAGRDDMGGTPANRLTTAASGVNGVTIGATGGVQVVTLVTGTIPSHRHTWSVGGSTGAGSGGAPWGNQVQVNNTGFTGGDGAHNNVQPTIVKNVFIKL